MWKPIVLAVFLTKAVGLSAQNATSPLILAEAERVCAPFGVASVRLENDVGAVVVCNEDATAFVPLLGALGPVIGLGVAATIARAISDGNATPDTR